MLPISLVSGAIPMLTGLLGKGVDLAKGAMDLAHNALGAVGEGSKIGGEEQQPQGPINF